MPSRSLDFVAKWMAPESRIPYKLGALSVRTDEFEPTSSPRRIF